MTGGRDTGARVAHPVTARTDATTTTVLSDSSGPAPGVWRWAGRLCPALAHDVHASLYTWPQTRRQQPRNGSGGDDRCRGVRSRRGGPLSPRSTPLFRYDWPGHPVAGTAGALFGFFSPDGAWIGFADTQTIRKVPASGGDPVTVTELTGPGAVSVSWGTNDTIVFVAGSFGSTLGQVAAAGGTAQSITELDADYGELLHAAPHILPDGRAVLFSTFPDPTVVLQSLDTGERKRLIEGERPHYVPTGHLVFFRGSTLWAAPFDLDRGEITGTAAPVLEGAVGAVATATNGLLANVSGLPPARRLVWVDREGREQPLDLEPGPYSDLELSPDDQRIALTMRAAFEGDDVWVYDVGRARGRWRLAVPALTSIQSGHRMVNRWSTPPTKDREVDAICFGVLRTEQGTLNNSPRVPLSSPRGVGRYLATCWSSRN